jgi:NTE family protein
MAARIALVLGGGGLKGFAHIGVLRALQELGVAPALYAGTSIGALIAAAAAAGMPTEDMAARAEALQRRDLFRLNHMGMLLERRRVPSIYAAEPLRELVESNVRPGTFEDLPVPVLVNTVDVKHGAQVVWGLPGLTNVSVRDAVYASCALPGFFPPGAVADRLCFDGGTIDNVPVQIAARDADAVIAVDVGSTDLTPVTDIGAQGFAAIYMRAATVMMHALQLVPLTHWSGPPMLLIRPHIAHVGWLTFTHTAELIDEGYRAAREAAECLDEVLAAPTGVFPRRRVRIMVDRAKCTGCGICAALAPDLMAIDGMGKAYARAERVEWSPADGDFIHHCPTHALSTRVADTHRLSGRLAAGEGDEAA